MTDSVQYDLFQPVHEQEFAAWKDTNGAGHVLAYCYAQAARYGERFRRTGRQVSVRLILELVRDHYGEVVRRCKRLGVDLGKFDGFAINNNFAPYIARHIEGHRPEWRGMFQKRGVGHVRKSRGVVWIPKDKRQQDERKIS